MRKLIITTVVLLTISGSMYADWAGYINISDSAYAGGSNSYHRDFAVTYGGNSPNLVVDKIGNDIYAHTIFAGTKIGAPVVAGDYNVRLADVNLTGPDSTRLQKALPNVETVVLDATNAAAMQQFLTENSIDAIISCLPYFCNPLIAELAKGFHCHYFDLTEDVQVTKKVMELAQDADTAFVPQCGLAPGFISIASNELIQHFTEVDTVKMRVGALPENASNALHYTMTWSSDGLINEYGNPCYGLEDGKLTMLHPLEGMEIVEIDGVTYEAFNTSGGLGSLAETYVGKIKNMTYKTVRYPGHCEKIQFLMNDLRLNEDRPTLKRILKNAIPKTYQDLVLIYVSVVGTQHGDFIEENYVVKVMPKTIHGVHWSAIQVTTAAALSAIVDLVLSNPQQYTGLVKQEDISFKDFMDNRFGQYYQ